MYSHVFCASKQAISISIAQSKASCEERTGNNVGIKCRYSCMCTCDVHASWPFPSLSATQRIRSCVHTSQPFILKSPQERPQRRQRIAPSTHEEDTPEYNARLKCQQGRKKLNAKDTKVEKRQKQNKKRQEKPDTNLRRRRATKSTIAWSPFG